MGSIRAAIALAVASGCGMLHAARGGTAGLVHEKSIYTDGGRKPLESPEGVGCGEDGRVVVADTAHGRVLLFTWSDGRLEGGSEIKSPQLPHPTVIQLDPAGNILVLDRKMGRIAVLDRSGAFVRYLDIAGAPRHHLAKPGREGFYHAIFVDGRNSGAVPTHLLTQEAIERYFQKLAPDSTRQMAFPTYVANDETGRLFVVDRNAQAIVLLDKDGGFLSRALRYGRADGLLNYPGQLCLTHSYAFVADRNNNRVQIFSILR